MSARRKPPEIIVRNGKPTGVIISVEEYREMLERLDDIEDIRALDKARRGKTSFRSLDAFLEQLRKAP